MKLDWLILCDAAQVTGNKLYVLGGGWDVITVAGLPTIHRGAVAVAVRVPWHETNQRHTVELEVVHDDGGSLVKVNGEFQVGQPPNALPGQDQRMQFAANLDLQLQHAGGYAMIARIDGEESERMPFRVVQAQPPQA